MGEYKLKPATIAAQGLGWIDEGTGSIIGPVYPSTTYLRRENRSSLSGRIYSRSDNPTYDQPESLLAALEQGSAAALFASGMAAATAVFLSLTPGDEVLAPHRMYWALRNWLSDFATRWGLKVRFVDMTDLAAVRSALSGSTKLVWLETPANPMWDISDIASIADMTHQVGGRLVVDSTVATPVLTRPLSLGADIVMHSATKYLNGHSDVVAGALISRTEDDFWARIKQVRTEGGGVPGPFESWLLTRGLRTLFPRVRLACSSAHLIAHHFAKSAGVSEVLYPGLPSFSGHPIAAKQMQGGFGAMLSIRVAAGEQAAISAARKVRVWKRATSLGGVESLIEHRASLEGNRSHVPRDLLRLSVGLEDSEDLIVDLEAALSGPPLPG